jgi:hypothetical protein
MSTLKKCGSYKKGNKSGTGNKKCNKSKKINSRRRTKKVNRSNRSNRNNRNSNSNKRGGSLASNHVMSAVNVKAPGKDAYKTMAHLPLMDDFKGGSRASDRLNSFMQDKSTTPQSELLETSEFKDSTLKGFNTKTYELSGGAKGDMTKNLVLLVDTARKYPEMKAETLVTNFHASRPMAHRITEKDLKNGKPKSTQKGGAKGDMKKNLVLMVDTARKNPEMKAETLVKNFHASRPMARRISEKDLKNGQKGGGGFLSVAGCGPVNAPDAGRKYASNFVKSESCPGPEWYANPPGLPSAGSGLADLGVGAPF